MDLLEEAYQLLSDVDKFGAGDSQRRNRITKWLARYEGSLTKRAPDFAICAAELHAKYDDEGDLYCRFCGKPLSG